ncbi:MAG TPA: hypothetical protein VFP31_03525 [Gaiellaceae bacterium]|nr:hypothetical protein [Gaiellaceae bacterium]
MRSTRKNQRKALKALALGFATAAIFTTTASAQVRSEAVSQSASEISYLSWGATADDLGPFAASLANQSTRDGGPVFMNGVPDGYVGSGVNLSDEGVTPTNLARSYHQPEQSILAGEGVTPGNLGRAYHTVVRGVQQPDGFQPQLQGDQPVIIRDRPDGFQPQTKTVESSTVSASSDGFDRGDLALGFGLGLILATACAIALAMTRDRQQTRMAHS